MTAEAPRAGSRTARLVLGLLLGLAVAGVAWYVIGIRQAAYSNQAEAIVLPPTRLGAAEARRASHLLNSAGFLNPDRHLDVLWAQLQADRGALGKARAILARVVASEPDNLEAWLGLARFSVGDLREFYRAAIAIRELIPHVPPPR